MLYLGINKIYANLFGNKIESLPDIGDSKFLSPKFPTRYSDFNFYLYGLIDIISQTHMNTVTTGPHYNYAGDVFGNNEPVIEADGSVLLHGDYENLLKSSEDISDPVWSKIEISTLAPNSFKALFLNGRMQQSISTSEGAKYTLSCIASVEPGGQTDNYKFRTNNSADGSYSDVFSISEIPTPYSITVLGAIGSASCAFGFADGNTSDWAEVTITNFQVTQTPYLLPYLKTTDATEQSAHTYSGGDEGTKLQLVPDEIGSVYTGLVDGVELFTNPALDTVDANNYSTFDVATGICRIVSDGTSVDILQNIFVTSDSYEITYTEITKTLGAIKLEQPLTEFNSGSETIRIAASGTICSFKRVGACDVTFRISVKKVSRNLGAPGALDALDGVADGVESVVGLTNPGANISVDGTTATVGTSGSDINAQRFYEQLPEVNAYVKVDFTLSGSTGEFKYYDAEVGDYLSLGSIAPGDYTIRTRPVNATDLLPMIAKVAGMVIEITSVKQISPTKGKMQVLWTPMFSWDDMTVAVNSNILTAQESSVNLIHINRPSTSLSRLYLRDGVTALFIDEIDWQANTPYRITAKWGPHPDHSNDLKMQIKVEDLTPGTENGPWESALVDFAGSFSPGNNLSLAWENDYPQKIKLISIEKEPKW